MDVMRLNRKDISKPNNKDPEAIIYIGTSFME
jgi:hypothetical protein